MHFLQFILSSLCECGAVLLAAHCYIKRSCHKHSEYNLNTFLCFLSCQNHRIQDSLGRKPSRTLLVKVSLIVAWKPDESAQRTCSGIYFTFRQNSIHYFAYRATHRCLSSMKQDRCNDRQSGHQYCTVC